MHAYIFIKIMGSHFWFTFLAFRINKQKLIAGKINDKAKTNETKGSQRFNLNNNNIDQHRKKGYKRLILLK